MHMIQVGRWFATITCLAIAACAEPSDEQEAGAEQASSADALSSSCEWYATTSLKQQQRNERGRCGFTGSEWQGSLREHEQFCESSDPDVWKAAARAREEQLRTCEQGANNDGSARRGCWLWSC